MSPCTKLSACLVQEHDIKKCYIWTREYCLDLDYEKNQEINYTVIYLINEGISVGSREALISKRHSYDMNIRFRILFFISSDH